MMLKQRQDEAAYRVCAKIGGDIAKAQPAVGIRIIIVNSNFVSERRGMHLIPSPRFGENLLPSHTRLKVHGVEQGAVDVVRRRR